MTENKKKRKEHWRAVVKKPIEVEANAFARSLLIPEKQMRDAVEAGMTDVGDLAQRFRVSSIVVRLRAKDLGMRGHGV